MLKSGQLGSLVYHTILMRVDTCIHVRALRRPNDEASVLVKTGRPVGGVSDGAEAL